MKFLKKKIGENKTKAQNAVIDFLKPKVIRLGAKLRLAGRIRLLNRLAAKNPQKTFAITVSTLSILVLVSFINPKEEEQRSISDLVNSAPDLQAMTHIQNEKDNQRRMIADLAHEAAKAKEEADSLLRLPVKTHGDSVRILQCYNKMKIIINQK